MEELDISDPRPGRGSSAERVTLYRHDEVASQFRQVSRYSDNPTWEQMGRGVYPDDEGMIGLGWSEGSVCMVRLSEDREKWNREMSEECGIPREVAENLGMQSRSIVAVRLDNAGDKLGILVFESLKPQGIRRDFEQKIPASAYLPALCRLLSLIGPVRDHGGDRALVGA